MIRWNICRKGFINRRTSLLSSKSLENRSRWWKKKPIVMKSSLKLLGSLISMANIESKLIMKVLISLAVE